MSLALRYVSFAIFATLSNILTQDIFLRVYSGNTYSGTSALVLSVLAGTAVGLLVKYSLDKKFIFAFQPGTVRQELNTFIIYTITGAGTTLLFWSVEFGFHFLYGTRLARYTGAVIGLTLGYIIKYQLDRRLVFVKGAA